MPEEVRRAAGLLERRWVVSILWASYEGAVRFNEFKQARRARSRRGRWRSGWSSWRRRACSSGAWSTRGRRGSSTG